jgi:hypothetical protein
MDGESALRVRRISASSKTKPGTTFGLGRISYRTLIQRPTKTKSYTVSAASEYYGWPPSCLDIARQMFEITPAYRNTRGALMNALRQAVAEAVELDSLGRPTFHLPSVPNLAFMLSNRIVEERDAYIKMVFWAGMYVGFGCQANNWPDATGSIGTFGGGTGISLQCHNEGWEISYDGGSTWDPITVSVCQYEMN